MKPRTSAFAKRLVAALWAPRTLEDAWATCQRMLDEQQKVARRKGKRVKRLPKRGAAERDPATSEGRAGDEAEIVRRRELYRIVEEASVARKERAETAERELASLRDKVGSVQRPIAALKAGATQPTTQCGEASEIGHMARGLHMGEA